MPDEAVGGELGLLDDVGRGVGEVGEVGEVGC